MRFPRIIISSDRSNSGKTIISSALMRVLSRKMKVRGFKAGPDFIDPKYHTLAARVPSINLDLWLMGIEGVKKSLIRYGKGYDIGIIEGVMGLYDGINVNYSTYELSEVTKTPIILVVNCSNVSSTVGAIVKGLKDYRNARIRGVIFNQIGSETHYNYCKSSIKEVQVLGYIKYDRNFSVPSRHLGLFTTEDFKETENVLQSVSKAIEESVDIDKIIEIANSAEELQEVDEAISNDELDTKKGIAAIAYDSAFNFYYSENIDLLRYKYQIEFFSPLLNEKIDNPSLIYVGGGYPELHLNELEKSSSTIRWIKKEAEKGTKILAECGGLMYLSKEIIADKSYKMVNLFDISIKAKDKLTIGYTELDVLSDNILGRKGEVLRGHEFHVSKAINLGNDVKFSMKNRIGKGIWENKDGAIVYNTLASYSHFHFSSARGLLSF
ncbi:cobyrinate a,c-diamide synthase [Sulfurisphaera tokodaii]|uniref:Cobyrinate a,c-diamide synthase n=2 Tax=Sulfurisphaera tokodaii TaxID=111955 RepID=CBIA_SULTO|nr:cobyrinate a,c-diamide synthase [Sulfurisphaera tokodaii]Q975N0.1 RecName: Full=Cobyrinate a,c-diamide synthase; AltName: Full=Cobyrinic acid a,c-diamide synthetase [Sulfurisphaera tokodaii str. 7]BAB65370.1 cobyrinic acid a,c-diamide synthase [Sulfurisphaera tokodaii str. 7]HII74932.1 cobyrinate a,c-diamide synthase [Sulfurisphaera tokodaii]